MVDLVYKQPLKELLQISSYFKEQLIVLVNNESEEKLAKQKSLIPCYIVDETSDLNKIKNKIKAVFGGSIAKNEFAVKIKADFLLEPSNEKQFFDLGLAKKLFDNNTTVIFLINEFLLKNSFDRHLYWKNYLEVVKYCKKKGTRFFVASGSKEFTDLKHPKMRESIAVMLGLDVSSAKKFLEFNK